MVNKHGSKVRLHFKLDQDQLWVGLKGTPLTSLLVLTVSVMYYMYMYMYAERTEKIPLSSVRQVLSEPIKGHEEYHIMVGLSHHH